MAHTKAENSLIYLPLTNIEAIGLIAEDSPNLKSCTPFFISVMIFSPEAGFKYFVKVQKSCSATNDPIWKLHFDLDRIIEGKFVRVLEIEIGAGTDGENEKVEKIAEEGINDKQSEVINNELYPAGKVLVLEGRSPTEQEANAINATMKKIIISG